VRRASRTSSERVRCSRFLALSTSATISPGSEIVKVCRDFMVVTLSYIVIHPIARPRSASSICRTVFQLCPPRSRSVGGRDRNDGVGPCAARAPQPETGREVTAPAAVISLL
jgi:hypothetical protein